MFRLLRSFLLIFILLCILCVSAFAVEDVPPSYPPFYGSGYVTGSSSQLGDITVYFPISYKDGFLGVDSNGYLFNVSNTSITCYLEGYDYCNIPAWSYPRYRKQSGNQWEYIDLYIYPEYSNCDISTEMEPEITVNDLLPYAFVLLMGVLFVCYIRRS